MEHVDKWVYGYVCGGGVGMWVCLHTHVHALGGAQAWVQKDKTSMVRM